MTRAEFTFSIISLGWMEYGNNIYRCPSPDKWLTYIYVFPEKYVILHTKENSNYEGQHTYLDAYNELTKND